MHWVDRGPEPSGLAPVRDHYTPRWISHYTHRVGERPTDSHWRLFRADLERVFFGICAYCEESTRGEVDHFRPKSRFPNLVYTWANWLFACHDCNRAKSDRWPATGFVDPCAALASDRPEHFFAFDTQTGFIKPLESLSSQRREMAAETIRALKLNDFHHRKKRVLWLILFSAAMPESPRELDANGAAHLTQFASRETQLSSIVRSWLDERGYSPDQFLTD